MPETPRCKDSHTYIQAANNNCFQMIVGGDGSYNNPYEMIGNIALSNGLVCTPDGISVCVSAMAKNQLRYNDDGCLYVSPPIFAQPDECELTNGCIKVTVLGSGCEGDEYKIIAEPLIDPNCGLLSCGPNGLCVTMPSIVGLSTECVDLIISGNGTASSPWAVESTLHLDPTPINSIKCTNQGLFAHTFINGGETSTSTTISNGSGTQADPYVITTDVKVDSLPGNALEITATGLRVESQARSKFVEVANLIAGADYAVNHNFNLPLGQESDVIVQVRDNIGNEQLVRVHSYTSNSLLIEALSTIVSARIVVLS